MKPLEHSIFCQLLSQGKYQYSSNCGTTEDLILANLLPESHFTACDSAGDLAEVG